MLNISDANHSAMARVAFVRRLAAMLLDAGTIRPEASRDELLAVVAILLDEGEARGIRTERLLGMYVLLRVSDQIEPFDDPAFAQVLNDPALSEPDKAHRLQMLRLERIG